MKILPPLRPDIYLYSQTSQNNRFLLAPLFIQSHNRNFKFIVSDTKFTTIHLNYFIYEYKCKRIVDITYEPRQSWR